MNLTSLFNSIPDTIAKFEQIASKPKVFVLGTMFLAPLYDFLVILTFFLVLDMVTSIGAQINIRKKKCQSKNIDKKEYEKWYLKALWRTINPSKLPKTIEKIFSYSLALIVCFILDYYILRMELGEDGRFYLLSITNVVYGLILITEAVSILRNIGSITNNAVFNQIIKILVKKTNTEDYIP